MSIEAPQDSPSSNLPQRGRGFVILTPWGRGFANLTRWRGLALIGGALVVIFSGLLLLAINSAVTVTISSDKGGSSVRLNDGEASITATLNLSAPMQVYYSQPSGSEFYYQSSGLLAWLGGAQGLRPGLGWHNLAFSGTQGSGQLVGMGAEEGSGISAGLVFSSADGGQYLALVQPEGWRVAWYRWVGQPGTMLASAIYHPTFGVALVSLLGEVALLFFYALGALLLIGLLAWLIKAMLGLVTRRVRVAMSVHTGQAVSRFFPLMLFGLALLLTGYVAYGVLDAMPHVQDSAAYIFQARMFAERRLLVPDPGAGLHDFLDHAYVLFYNGAWFSKYPPGYPLLLALGVLIGQPAIIDPLCGAAALLLVYLTGRRLFSTTVGALAALLGLVSPFFLTMSGAILSHSASMLGTAAFLYFFVVARQADYPPPIDGSAAPTLRLSRWRRGITYYAPLLAGLSIGWVVITRELSALGIAAPFVVYALVDLAINRNWPTLRRYLLMVVGALPLLLFLLIDNYVLTGGPLDFPQNLQTNFDLVGFGPGHGGDPLGHSPALGLANAIVYLREIAKDLFGWPGPFTFVFVALAFLPLTPSHLQDGGGQASPAPIEVSATALLTQNSKLKTQNSSFPYARLLLLGGALGLVGAYFFWWAAARVFGPRYWYEMLPFLLLLTALGVVNAGRWVGNVISSGAGGNTRAGMAASGLLLTLLVAYSALQFTPQYIASFQDYNNMNPAERDTVAKAALHHAVVFVQLDAQTVRRDYSRVFWLNDPLLTHGADVIWLRDLGAQRDKVAMQQYFAGWSGWVVNRTALHPLR